MTETSFANRPANAYALAPLEDEQTARPARVIFNAPKPSPAPIVSAPPQSSAFTGAALIIGLGALLFYLSNDRAFLLGQIAAIVCTPLALLGLVKGGTRKVMTVIAVFGACYAVVTLPGAVEPILTPMIGPTALLAAYAATAASGLLLVILCTMWSKRIRGRLHSSSAGQFFDRWFGATVGTAEGALVILTVCWVSTMLRPQAERLRDQASVPIDSFRHQFAGNLIRVADEASIGPLGEFVRSTNPIEQSPALKSMIQNLNETGKFSLKDIDPKLVESVQKMLQGNGANGTSDLKTLLNQYQSGFVQK